MEGKPHLEGLIDVSFSNPYKDGKDYLPIYESTQILHQLNQSKGDQNIPILIMNHLPILKKTKSKFYNYCAFLNRKALEKYK